MTYQFLKEKEEITPKDLKELIKLFKQKSVYALSNEMNVPENLFSKAKSVNKFTKFAQAAIRYYFLNKFLISDPVLSLFEKLKEIHDETGVKIATLDTIRNREVMLTSKEQKQYDMLYEVYCAIDKVV